MSKSISNTLWATLSGWIQQILSFITVLIVARLVSPAAFGVIAIALLFILFFQRILLESIGYLVIRQEQEKFDNKYINSAHLVCILVSLLLASGLYFTAGAISKLFDMPDLAPVLRFLSIIPIFDGLSTVQTALFKRNMQFKFITLRTAVANFVSGISGIVLAYAGFDIWALAAQQVIGSAIGCVVLYISSTWKPKLNITKSNCIEIVKTSIPMMGNAILFVLNNRLDIMMLGYFSTPIAVGFYSLGKRVVRTITDLFLSGVNSVSLSMFSLEKENFNELSIVFFTVVKYTAFLIVPSFAFLASASEELIFLVLGSKWEPMASVVVVLSIAGIVQLFSLFSSNLFIAIGLTREIFIINFISFFVFAVLIFVFKVYGGVGVAVSFLIQILVAMLIMFFSLERKGFPILKLILRSSSLTVFISFLMSVVVVVVSALIDIEGCFYILLIKITIAVLTYFLLNFIFQKELLLDCVSKCVNFFSRRSLRKC